MIGVDYDFVADDVRSKLVKREYHDQEPFFGCGIVALSFVADVALLVDRV